MITEPATVSYSLEDHASGPECYRQALKLLREARTIRERVAAHTDEVFTAEGVNALNGLEHAAAARVTEAGVWAQLAAVAAGWDTAERDEETPNIAAWFDATRESGS